MVFGRWYYGWYEYMVNLEDMNEWNLRNIVFRKEFKGREFFVELLILVFFVKVRSFDW